MIHLEGELVHHLSFVDCPGHYELIITMLSNIEVMDGIILVVSAAEVLSAINHNYYNICKL